MLMGRVTAWHTVTRWTAETQGFQGLRGDQVGVLAPQPDLEFPPMLRDISGGAQSISGACGSQRRLRKFPCLRAVPGLPHSGFLRARLGDERGLVLVHGRLNGS